MASQLQSNCSKINRETFSTETPEGIRQSKEFKALKETFLPTKSLISSETIFEQRLKNSIPGSTKLARESVTCKPAL